MGTPFSLAARARFPGRARATRPALALDWTVPSLPGASRERRVARTALASVLRVRAVVLQKGMLRL